MKLSKKCIVAALSLLIVSCSASDDKGNENNSETAPQSIQNHGDAVSRMQAEESHPSVTLSCVPGEENSFVYECAAETQGLGGTLEYTWSGEALGSNGQTAHVSCDNGNAVGVSVSSSTGQYASQQIFLENCGSQGIINDGSRMGGGGGGNGIYAWMGCWTENGYEITCEASASGGGGGPYSYFWTPGEVNDASGGGSRSTFICFQMKHVSVEVRGRNAGSAGAAALLPRSCWY